MRLVVRLLGRAQADVDDIYAWLGRRTSLGAIAWYAALLEKLHELADTASSCSLAPEAARLGIELRQAFFKTRRGRRYRLVFLIADHEARVLRVRGAGQRPVTRRDLPADREGMQP
jgi:plasmid stabilization system protein ParE